VTEGLQVPLIGLWILLTKTQAPSTVLDNTSNEVDKMLDQNLLKEALRARDRLIDLEYESDKARASYQHSIRRLHASGASLREIAETLDLSHQRVHQIVEAVAGKVAFKEESDWSLNCSFCGLSQKQVTKLIAGPGVFICDACVALADAVVDQGKPRANDRTRLTAVTAAKTKCSFCGKKREKVDNIAETQAHPSGKRSKPKNEGPIVRICNECLDLCNQILTEEADAT
jgi:hypothetical protein